MGAADFQTRYTPVTFRFREAPTNRGRLAQTRRPPEVCLYSEFRPRDGGGRRRDGPGRDARASPRA